MNKLEKDYFAEIDAWKQKKDDEAYQAKKKAEEDFWNANDKLIKLWPQVEKVCSLTEKCESYNINLNCFYTRTGISIVEKSVRINGSYENRFFIGMHGSNSDLIITEDGLKKVSTCKGYIEQENSKLFAFEVDNILNQLPNFFTKFYEKLDEILEN